METFPSPATHPADRTLNLLAPVVVIVWPRLLELFVFTTLPQCSSGSDSSSSPCPPESSLVHSLRALSARQTYPMKKLHPVLVGLVAMLEDGGDPIFLPTPAHSRPTTLWPRERQRAGGGSGAGERVGAAPPFQHVVDSFRAPARRARTRS